VTQSILARDTERFHHLAIPSYPLPNSEVRYRIAPSFAPPVPRSLFGAREFILTGRTGVNRPVAVVEWRRAGAAAAKETAEERDQRYLYRVHRPRRWLLNVLELPHLVIDALGVGNQTDIPKKLG